MSFNLLLLLTITNCKMYVIETESQGHQQVESSIDSPTETGNDYMDSYEVVEHTRPNKKQKHVKKKIRGNHPKTVRGYAHKENTGLETGQDYGWINMCSFKKPCSEESCMIQKDIPGCGGSIDLLCTGGCLNILKVNSPSSGCGCRVAEYLCLLLPRCATPAGPRTPHPSQA